MCHHHSINPYLNAFNHPILKSFREYGTKRLCNHQEEKRGKWTWYNPLYYGSTRLGIHFGESRKMPSHNI